MNSLVERVEDSKEMLTAYDLEDLRVRYLQGYIMAIRDTLDIKFEEEEQ